MARNIFIVNATQVVTSDSHPEGLFSVISGFPKTYDSNSYPTVEAALNAAKSEYYSRLAANYAGSTTRVMATVTLNQANGQIILRDCTGGFPAIASEPEEGSEPSQEPEEPEPVETPTEGA